MLILVSEISNEDDLHMVKGLISNLTLMLSNVCKHKKITEAPLDDKTRNLIKSQEQVSSSYLLIINLLFI